MTRIVLFMAVLFVLALAVIKTVGDDTLYWKRRALLTILSPSHLPDAYYEPSQLIEGGTGTTTPRVDPSQEKLRPGGARRRPRSSPPISTPRRSSSAVMATSSSRSTGMAPPPTRSSMRAGSTPH